MALEPSILAERQLRLYRSCSVVVSTLCQHLLFIAFANEGLRHFEVLKGYIHHDNNEHSPFPSPSCFKAAVLSIHNERQRLRP